MKKDQVYLILAFLAFCFCSFYPEIGLKIIAGLLGYYVAACVIDILKDKI